MILNLISASCTPNPIQIRRFSKHSLIVVGLAVIGLVGLTLTGSVLADELEECMQKMLPQFSDSTTVGEIRSHCAERIRDETSVQQDDEPAVVVDRFKEDRENALQPFTLMAHKPNYFLAGA